MLLAGLLMVMMFGGAWSMDVHRMSVEEEITFNQKMRSKAPQAVTFAFAKHFQDHMVLQGAPARATVYGFAPESAIGQQVTVELSGPTISTSSYQAKVVESAIPGAGQWIVTFDPMPMGAPAIIRAELQGNSLTLNDVLFGDVWICSGQSNMEFTVIMMLRAKEEIAEANNYPKIRLMTVARRDSRTPQYDLIEIEERWGAPTKKSVGGPAWHYFSAVCWLFGKGIHQNQSIPVGLVATDWGGTPVEAWSSPDSLAECGVKESSPAYVSASYKRYIESLPEKDRYRLQGPSENSVLYNAMIHPLLNMTIKGAIWYQGESDASGAKMNRYNCTFPRMIKDWRKKFNMGSGGQTDPTFPFGFVQLAADHPGPTRTVGFPDIRWHQTADWGYVPNKDMPNVFMAVAMDLPDFNSTYGSVHPRDKTDVGIRLTLSGLAVVYGLNSSWNNFQGPFPKKAAMATEFSGLLKIDYGDEWLLHLTGGSGFEFQCGMNNVTRWVPTTIKAEGHTYIFLDASVCEKEESIRALRYAWMESPCVFQKCAIYSDFNFVPPPPYLHVKGVPAPPFIAFAKEGDVMFTFDGPVHF